MTILHRCTDLFTTNRAAKTNSGHVLLWQQTVHMHVKCIQITQVQMGSWEQYNLRLVNDESDTPRRFMEYPYTIWGDQIYSTFCLNFHFWKNPEWLSHIFHLFSTQWSIERTKKPAINLTKIEIKRKKAFVFVKFVIDIYYIIKHYTM